MCTFDSVSVIIVCYLCYVYSVVPFRDDSETEIEDETLPEDYYTFVALLDIVFINGAKKSCTGTIIHDNVVITAAHCFTVETNHSIQPEMTSSFVVIGTKKMFESGYEQYLPIERIIIHPKYEGWTSDLALVHTFAGMMSDKPGQVILLASERTNTPVDSDVKVFSWANCTDEEVTVTNLILETEDATVFEDKLLKLEDENNEKKEKENKDLRHREKKRHRNKSKNEASGFVPVTRPLGSFGDTTIIRSIEDKSRFGHRERQYDNFSEVNSDAEEKKLAKLNQLYERSEVNRDRMNQRDRRETRGTISQFINWRRKLGNEQNKLTVEVFGFVNMHACQKLLYKSKALSLHKIDREEIICYSSERRYITEDDAGAPAIRKGRLVAVTVGGADFEGEHVAIGLKMVCFCSWIADNLPKKQTDMQCCTNCCSSSHEETEMGKYKRRARRKKKLRLK